MTAAKIMEVNTLIVGGGAAGLWLLDTLRRQAMDGLLIERNALGAGQTICSQGIIHGGVKYSLVARVTGSAKAIRRMPEIWRRSLAGEAEPNLSTTQLRAGHCHLWHTTALGSRLGFSGAKKALQVTPTQVAFDQRPQALAQIPGKVLRLDEQVISPKSFLQTLAQANAGRILSCRPPIETSWQCPDHSRVESVTLSDGQAGRSLRIEPKHVVLTAGQGNSELRQTLGLEAPSSFNHSQSSSWPAMQRRPLHMVVARGRLPTLNGHCIDGQKTRLTITSEPDEPSIYPNQAQADPLAPKVWQIGGQVSEVGVNMEPDALIRHTLEELEAVLPSVDLRGIEWTTYRVDRAEPKTPAGVRPEQPWAKREGNVITAWPTKLALAPELTSTVLKTLQSLDDQPASVKANAAPPALEGWPTPEVSAYPWEGQTHWMVDA